MPRELRNANITHVSYVDKAANKKRFFLTKSEEQPTFERDVRFVTKSEDEKMLVYGVVYEPETEDAHGDFMKAEEIEKAAHQFMKDARNIDKQHDFQSGVGEVVESYIAPTDFTVGEETITKGSWVLVTKASEEVWEEIKKGEITGYSMAGTAEAIEVEKAEEQSTDSEDEQAKSFFKMVKDFFTNNKTEVQKGEVLDRFNKTKKQRDFFTAKDLFDSVFYDEVWNSEPDVERIREALNDFGTLLTEIADAPDLLKALGPIPENIQKAGRKISDKRLSKLKDALATLQGVIDEVDDKNDEEEEIMKAEDIQKMLDEALKPINEKLDTLEKAQGEVVEKHEETVEKADETAKAVQDAIEKALAPINERLETVEKARGIAKSEKQETQTDIEKSDDNIWNGLL